MIKGNLDTNHNNDKIIMINTINEKMLKDDLLSRLDNLDWDLLDKLANDENEAKCSALNTRTYSEFKQSYDDYKRRFSK